MTIQIEEKELNLQRFLKAFSLETNYHLFNQSPEHQTVFEEVNIQGKCYNRYINEFWTSRQRQSSSLHEIAYRACFKAQLPRFFITLFTQKGDYVYDPFSGRGTTVIEAALLERNIVSNDINPISKILTRPRLTPPKLNDLERRLTEIPMDHHARADIDLSMFYHPETESEIVSLKNYLQQRNQTGQEDELDSWIRMVATNRLTGHSTGFFSVYTLPPNQAVFPERQRLINRKRNQQPDYRDVKKLILKKSESLLRDFSIRKRKSFLKIANKWQFLEKDARDTNEIEEESIQLTVTSPPFLNVVQYANDNWLRCWFNGIDTETVSKTITMASTIDSWADVMEAVFRELYRITRKAGWVAFEVGEVQKGKIKLEEYVVPLGERAGFLCKAILINQQSFTKTSNIWGVQNNAKGTNTNRIVIFKKESS